MSEPKRTTSPVVHVDDVKAIEHLSGEHWGAAYKPLTPWMTEGGGKLGINLNRVPPGRTTCPFHHHALEDEAFYILSGRGVLRYGDELFDLEPGHCVSCPAGTGTSHQIANPYEEDLVYLAVGNNEPDEVCYYPDSGKVLVRSLAKLGVDRIGRLEGTSYMDGESEVPTIFEKLKERDSE